MAIYVGGGGGGEQCHPWEHAIKWKNNRFPFLEILGNSRVFQEYPQKSQIWKSETSPNQELGWEFPGWDLSHFAKFGIFMGIL